VGKSNSSLIYNPQLGNRGIKLESQAYKLWAIVCFLTVQGIPSICLLYLNLRIVLILRSKNTKLKRNPRNSMNKNAVPLKQFFILFSISLLTLMLSLVGIFVMVEVILLNPWFLYGTWFIWPPIEAINSSVNFVFYILFSKQFRMSFVKNILRQ